MGIFFKIAWRDLLRYKLRSGLTLAAITFGTALTLFTMALARGEHQGMIESSIGLFPGHMQVHAAGYQEDKILMRSMPLNRELVEYLDKSRLVKSYSPRLCTDTLLQAGGNLAGAQICGIYPDKEVQTSKLGKTFFPELQNLPPGKEPFRKYQGNFLSNDSFGEAVIGVDLARNLQAEVGDEISIISQDFYGSIAAGTFKVKGIFKVASPDLDSILMLVNINELSELLYMPGRVTEVALLLNDSNDIPSVTRGIYALYSRDSGPWRVERTGNNTWLVKSFKPNIGKDSFLQLADQEITINAVKRIPGLVADSARVKAKLLTGNETLNVLGIDPGAENAASGLASRIKGRPDIKASLSGKDWILLSAKNAEVLGAAEGQELKVEGENYLGRKYKLILKVKGIYSPVESDPQAYLSLELLKEKQGLGDNIHEVLLRLDDKVDTEKTQGLILSRLNREVLSWEELMPDLVQFVFLDNAAGVLWLMILLVVIAFVVLLTILMSVLERSREFGIMKAIGTRPADIFNIILIESALLGLVGGVAGLVLGAVPAIYLMRIPLDVSSFSDSMSEFGIEPYIYARLEPMMLFWSMVIILVIVMIMTVFPAIRAARTTPVQVLRLQ